MLSIAHVWLLEQLVEQPTPAHYLGCVWPDMLFQSPLTHRQSHRQGQALWDYARSLPAKSEERETFRAFVAGALTHGAEPHGFDWYSDEEYGGLPAEARGYAFQRGAPLAEDAAKACGVPPDQGWWKAHNFIEMAFERALYADNPRRGEAIAGACADEGLLATMSHLLAPHVGHAAEALAAPMRVFPGLVALQPTSVESLARAYAAQVPQKHPGAQPDEAAIARLIERAERMIAPHKRIFLDSCVEQVRAMLVDVIG